MFPTSTPPSRPVSILTAVVIATVLGGMLLACLLVFCSVKLRNRKAKGDEEAPPPEKTLSSPPKLQLDLPPSPFLSLPEPALHRSSLAPENATGQHLPLFTSAVAFVLFRCRLAFLPLPFRFQQAIQLPFLPGGLLKSAAR
jgi:hypothetical protein